MERTLARTCGSRALLVQALVAMVVAMVVMAFAPRADAQRGRIIVAPSHSLVFHIREPTRPQVRARRGALRFAGWRRPRGARGMRLSRVVVSHANAGSLGTPTSPVVAVSVDRTREDSSIVVAGGSAQAGDVEHVRCSILPLVPAALIRRLEADRVRIVVARGNVLDARPEWASRPPTDEFELSWDNVPAAFDPERRELIVAAPAGNAGASPHARDALTQDWLFHQIGHAFDTVIGGEHDSASTEFTSATAVIVLERRHPTVRPLTRDESREVFATSFAMFHLEPERLRSWHPRLLRFWRQNRGTLAMLPAPPPAPDATVAVAAPVAPPAAPAH